MKLRVPLLVTSAAVLLVAGACQKGGGKSGGSPTPTLVHVVAHMVKGPASASSVPFSPFAPPANSQWSISPASIRLTVDYITFHGADANVNPSTTFSNCSITFDRTTPSHTSLLDCPFDMPSGSYYGLSLGLGSAYQIAISDSANGFYTDPTAPGGLTTTPPVGGASPVTVVANFGNGFNQTFTHPFVVSSASPPSISIALDALQNTSVEVTAGVASFRGASTGNFYSPVYVYPTIDSPGSIDYLDQSRTAGDLDTTSAANTFSLRIYFAPGSNGQPVFAMIPDTSQTVGSCFANVGTFAAFDTDPSVQPPLAGGARVGGWLARDPAGTICWVLPADPAYSSYAAYMTLTVTGTSGVFSCEATSTPTAPTGNTYEAGCPPITPTATANVGLVAQ